MEMAIRCIDDAGQDGMEIPGKGGKTIIGITGDGVLLDKSMAVYRHGVR